MATVSVQATGGKLQLKEASTVGDLKKQMGLESYQATVNGDAQEDSYTLEENAFVALSPKVKGA